MNKPGPTQIGAPLKFPEYAKETIFKLQLISQCQNIRMRLENHFFPDWKYRQSIFES